MQNQDKSLFIVFGPNGVGKGTLAGKLADDLKFSHLNMGNLIRQWISKNKLHDYEEELNNGNLMPDEIVEKVLKSEVDREILHDAILDGFPRRKSQVDILEKLCEEHNLNLDGIILLNAPLEVILERLTQRVVAPNGKVYHLTYNPPSAEFKSHELHRREDDRPAIVEKRYGEYIVNTLECMTHPFFKDIEVCSIDGTKSIDQVYREAKEFIKARLSKV